MKARFLVSLAVAAALGLAPGDANAFCRSTTCSADCSRDSDGCKLDGAPLFWASYCVGFSLQSDGSEHIPFSTLEAVVAQSFVAWTELECGRGNSSLLFTQLGDVSCHRAEYNPSGANANVIMVQDHKWDYKGVENTLAKTTVTYDVDTGEILDADIELNHMANELTVGDEVVVEYDLQSILTHEVGHFIGLDHTPIQSATMNAGYDKGNTHQRVLDADDIDGLCAAYPPGRDATCRPEPRGGFGKDCPDEAEDGCRCATASQSSLGDAALWPALFVLFALRRRLASG
jgi:MYXO-CTERM domain-containing protein